MLPMLKNLKFIKTLKSSKRKRERIKVFVLKHIMKHFLNAFYEGTDTLKRKRDLIKKMYNRMYNIIKMYNRYI